MPISTVRLVTSETGRLLFLRGIVDRFAETGTHELEFYSEYSLPTGYHEKLFDALKSYFKCTGEDYTTIDETIYMEYLGGADVDGYSLKFSPEALVSAVERLPLARR